MDSTFRSNSGISPSSALRPSNHSFPFNTTFQQPSWSPAAQNNPNREHYIMLDRSVGWIRTTEQEAREGASIGYAVFDLAGYRPSWDPSRNRSARAREEAVVGAFERQFVEVWDAEEQVVMALEAHLDEEIYYDTEAKVFRRRKVDTGKAKKEGQDGRGVPLYSGAGAAGAVADI